MKEKQLVQQQYEDRFKLRVAEAASRKLQQQNGQMREVAVAEASATVSIATTATKIAAEIKRKSKAKAAAGADGGEPPKSKKAAAVSKTNGDGDVVKRKKDVAKSVAFSPRKQPTAAIFQAAPAARRRSLEEAFNEEKEPNAMNKGVPKKSAADELMRMLSQDKGSDSEEDEASIGNLLLSFSPAKTSTERRYGSPSKAKTKETTNDTPSKFTPSKLARSVVKKAMAAPLDFDFTRRAELAKAKAAKEKQQAAEQNDNDDDSDEEEAASTETPSKKALKRRKDLGISLSTKPAAPSKATQAKSTSAGSDATKTATAARGGKSLMEMVSAASLVEAKLPKPKETSTRPKKSVTAASSEQEKPPLPEQSQAKEPAKPKQKGRPTKDKKSDSAEPEAEDFIGIQTANITKRAKPKQFAKSAKASSAPSEPAAEPEAEDAAVQKKSDKLSAAEQAIAKADMLTRMTKMQDIATPKVPGKKMKKVLKKTTMTALAAKRAEFQKILADGATSDAAGSRDTDGDDIGEDAGAFETPRKARTMKRKRAQDLPGQADVGGLAKKTAVTLAPQTQTGYLQSPSVAALLAMRPSKSPIGIRYVPKTPKTPQSVQTRQRPTDDDNNVQNPAGAGDAPTTFAAQGASAGLLTRAKKNSVKAARNAFAGTTGALTSVAGGLWGNSGPSFFDAFVNGGAPRLKRSALP